MMDDAKEPQLVPRHTRSFRATSHEEYEVKMAENAHDMAMSREPGVASTGRFLKMMTPVLMRWFEEEKNRRLDPGTVLVAYINGAGCLNSTMSNLMAKPNAHAEALRGIAEAIHGHGIASAKIAEQENAGRGSSAAPK